MFVEVKGPHLTYFHGRSQGYREVWGPSPKGSGKNCTTVLDVQKGQKIM